jgi:hypothetical protein
MYVVRFDGVHHGGLINGSISSIMMVFAVYSGYCLTRCSRFDMNVPFGSFRCLAALRSKDFVGCFDGSVWTRVRYFVICLRSSSSIGIGLSLVPGDQIGSADMQATNSRILVALL